MNLLSLIRFVRNHLLGFSLVLGVACGFVPSANCALLVNPSSGTVRLSASVGDINKDDGVYQSSYFYEGEFFNSPLIIDPFVTVSINGHIRFGEGDGYGDYFLQSLGGNGINRVAPMWADFTLGGDGQIIENTGDSYYAITWLNLQTTDHPGTSASFQVIFIENNTLLNGNAFQAGDIIFSYGGISVYPEILEVIIGLENSNGSHAALPGHEPFGGWHSYAAFGDFPVEDDQYVLFRHNGIGDYDVSIQTIVPEPSAYAAFIGLLTLLGIAYRHRR